MSPKKPVRTRIAPSPTGQMHVGTLRTALYNYAYAMQNQGQFILRIEDTDQKRLVADSQENILNILKTFKLSYDEGPIVGGSHGPYIQTQRLKIYQKYIQKLLDKGLVYYCFCTADRLEKMRQNQKTKHQKPHYDRHCLSLTDKQIQKKLKSGHPFVIRLKVPDNKDIIGQDLIRGQISINSAEVDDQVLIKSDGIPTYHFAVVVDDHLMKISHVIRGDEWISSLPKQILLYQYFGWKPPIFVHLPVFLDPDGKGKMSKRRGSVSVQSFLDQGYIPVALLNYLMLLGWNPGTDREIFSLKQFVTDFNLKKVHKTQPVFDSRKLDYINGYYVRHLSSSKIAHLLAPFIPKLNPAIIKQIAPVLKERITKLTDAIPLTEFLYQDVDYSSQLLFQRGADKDLIIDMLSKSQQALKDCDHWHFQLIQMILTDLIAKNKWNTGQFFMILRVAICGAPRTLPVVECLPHLGQEKTLHKLSLAIEKLN